MKASSLSHSITVLLPIRTDTKLRKELYMPKPDRRLLIPCALSAALLLTTFPREARAECGTGCVALIVGGVVAIAGLVVFAITRDERALEEDDNFQGDESSISTTTSRLALKGKETLAKRTGTQSPSAERPTASQHGASPIKSRRIARATSVFSAPNIQELHSEWGIKRLRLKGAVVRDRSGRVSGYAGSVIISF